MDFSAVSMVSLFEVDDDTGSLVRVGEKNKTETKLTTTVCFVVPY